jgi:hypothetical protein
MPKHGYEMTISFKDNKVQNIECFKFEDANHSNKTPLPFMAWCTEITYKARNDGKHWSTEFMFDTSTKGINELFIRLTDPVK